MASETDVPNKMVAEMGGNGPVEGITLRDKQLTALKLFVSVLDETASLFKLYFGLDTGAVVLFVKVLTDTQAPTIVLTALAMSTFLFGLSALMCLALLIGLLQIRGRIATEVVNIDPNWQKKFDSDIQKWQTDMKSAGKNMQWMFGLAILFAGLFLLGILIAHARTHALLQ
jgi:hypothetical protein